MINLNKYIAHYLGKILPMIKEDIAAKELEIANFKTSLEINIEKSKANQEKQKRLNSKIEKLDMDTLEGLKAYRKLSKEVSTLTKEYIDLLDEYPMSTLEVDAQKKIQLKQELEALHHVQLFFYDKYRGYEGIIKP